MITVDTNVLIHLWLPSDKTAISEKIYQLDDDWIAPLLWRSEYRNVVFKYIRRGVSLKEGLEAIQHAEKLMKENEFQVNSEDVMNLAYESGCTTYDCEFVHIAITRSVPLITFDSQVLRSFPDVAIDPLIFVGKQG
jgi:predicted nucleic acid-binding protein